jgi:putative ABC transport system substrate-binding protein
MDRMRRRKFLRLMGGAAVAWPLGARGQQVKPVVGLLRSSPQASFQHLVGALHQGLKEAGFTDGDNVILDARWADNRADRLPELAAQLIKRPVNVIVADNIAALAAKAATATVPIVVATAGDPVASGLVASLNRPGGNVTGVSFFGGVLGGKRLEMLRQLVPPTAMFAMLVHPGTPTTDAERKDVEAAARKLGQQLVVREVGSDKDIEAAFAAFSKQGAGALLVGSGTFIRSREKQILELTARHRLPASYVWRETVAAGGLMSYGASVPDAYRQAGIYAGRILKGEKPADLPVIQATKLELVLNLKTAKALGLAIPDRVLALADEVME